MKFVIRSATEIDANGIHKVLSSAFKEFKHFYSKEAYEDTILTGVKALDRIREMDVFVAVEENGTIIGTIGWEKVNQEEGHIRGMAVDPDWQGKEIADALLQVVEKEALSENCSFLSLDTTEILQRAQNFYRKHGFKKSGKTGDFFGNTIYEFLKELD